MKRVFKILAFSFVVFFYSLGLGVAANFIVVVPATSDAACIGSGCAAVASSTGSDSQAPFFDVFSPSTLLLFGLGLIALSAVGRKIVRNK